MTNTRGFDRVDTFATNETVSTVANDSPNDFDYLGPVHAPPRRKTPYFDGLYLRLSLNVARRREAREIRDTNDRIRKAGR